MKNPLTPSGIEPATFGFVAQHLNHCATAILNRLVITLVLEYSVTSNITTSVFNETPLGAGIIVLILAHPVYKIRIVQEPNTLEL